LKATENGPAAGIRYIRFGQLTFQSSTDRDFHRNLSGLLRIDRRQLQNFLDAVDQRFMHRRNAVAGWLLDFRTVGFSFERVDVDAYSDWSVAVFKVSRPMAGGE
jgi:hypothetical protein